jgi:hypothetical protein
MDIIDASVFDYLIGNADRHNYETFSDHPHSILVMLDSAKRYEAQIWQNKMQNVK